MLKGTRFEDSEFKKVSCETNRCVEVAHRDGVVAVRSTTDPAKDTVYFTREEWSAFIAGVKNSEFDL